MSALAPNLGPWSPPRLGLPRALVIALVIEGLIVVLLLWPWHHAPTPPPPAMPQQVTTVQFVKLPPPAPPKPVPVPRIVPPPPIPKPAIVIPKKIKPKPVVHHQPKPRPIHHVVPKPKPVPKPAPHPHVVPHPAPQVVKAKAPAPRVAPVSGPSPSAIAAYSQALHVLIQNNVVVGEMVRQLGLSGSVRVRFVLGPQGGAAQEVQVVTGGANPLLRHDALKTVGQLRYPPFPKSFGTAPRTFEVVVQINSSN
ncbi:hypothetical protein BI364_04605 [Acidihalobacter yilgarnensis]|uniref:TonB C-terminal domain-containing protein n=1 Tax=Acidihalobacter yilgarnensis TaxID=2819280 RepID=A0A1D8ILL8_9GAMM|nr:energy transducer TonB [Acidihalobacter yilgarnensis]AOU97367.1 hypothetical protein BI364_04605 [Acidihalobacter yilgarnensis]